MAIVSAPSPAAAGSSSSSTAAAEAAAVAALSEAFSRLNPLAREFVPSPRSRLSPGLVAGADGTRGSASSADSDSDDSGGDELYRMERSNSYNRWRMSGSRLGRAEVEESVRRTVYVSYIDLNVTEEKLAKLFSRCGQVVDCRICGDPHLVLRFAFIEFANEVGARAALRLDGSLIGFYQLRVSPSKTAILPVNPKFLPQSDHEKNMVLKTVYCTNIDKQISEDYLKIFFEQYCGKVSRMRLLSDYVHSTCFAFVEFVHADCAIRALNLSGSLFGSRCIRISPSKTPVRPRTAQHELH